MPDRVFQPRVQSGLILKILDYVLYLRRVYAFGIEDARQFLHHIADSPGKDEPAMILPIIADLF